MAILGIDEVGRGSWAGPLVVGAAVLKTPIDGLTDSKLLSRKKREVLNETILASGAAVGLGWVRAMEIDRIGLAAALRLATRRAVAEARKFEMSFEEVIIDGTVNLLAGTSLEKYAVTMKKADLLIGAVSAASICAKVARDKYMMDLEKNLPGYGFKEHVGYGTLKHREAIVRLGVSAEHRRSFRPVMELLGEAKNVAVSSLGTSLCTDDMDGSELRINTKKIGDLAEERVSEYLARLGHNVAARNWKNRFCEIDIVSELDGVLYFTEVKYRRNGKFGSGLAYITPKKLKQMEFSAQIFLRANHLQNVDFKLAAVEVGGDDYVVGKLIIM